MGKYEAYKIFKDINPNSPTFGQTKRERYPEGDAECNASVEPPAPPVYAFTINPTTHTFSEGGGSTTINVVSTKTVGGVTTTVPYTVTRKGTSTNISNANNVITAKKATSYTADETETFTFTQAESDKVANLSVTLKALTDSVVSISTTKISPPGNIPNSGAQVVTKTIATYKSGKTVDVTNQATYTPTGATNNAAKGVFDVPANTDTSVRAISIKVDYSGVTTTITMNQDAQTPDIVVFEANPVKVSFDSDAGSKNVAVTSTVNNVATSWSVKDPTLVPSWITLSGVGTTTLKITVTKNK